MVLALKSRRTLASAVRNHGRPVVALGACQAVLGLAALEAVARTRAAVAVVDNVLVEAFIACHRQLLAPFTAFLAVKRTL